MVNVKKQRERAAKLRSNNSRMGPLMDPDLADLPFKEMIPKDGRYLCPFCDQWTLVLAELTEDDALLQCQSCQTGMGMSREQWDDPQVLLMSLAMATRMKSHNHE